jgi:hypothetical protein
MGLREKGKLGIGQEIETGDSQYGIFEVCSIS